MRFTKKSAREMERIVDVAASLGNALHDHIIVGRHASLKGLKLI
jgi:hypothetical protein